MLAAFATCLFALQPAAADWQLPIRADLSAGRAYSDTATASVRTGATDGFDGYTVDVPQGPAPVAGVRCDFPHADWVAAVQRLQHFTRDARSALPPCSSKTWAFRVECLSAGNVGLVFDVRAVPAHYSVMLRDLGDDASYDLRTTAYPGFAATAGSVRAFELTVSSGQADAFEADDDVVHAKPIACGDVQEGRTLCPAGDRDWVTFTLAETKRVRLETEGEAGGDTYLYLYDTALNVLVSNDDKDPAARNFYSRITIDALPAGTYYAMVRHYFAAKTISSYSLSLQCSSGDWYEDDGDADHATALQCGETQQDHSILPAGDRDWVKFVLNECSRVTLETAGEPGGDTYLHLYDSGLRPLASNDDRDPVARNRYSRITVDRLSPGTYYAMVQHYFADRLIGSYSISLACTPVDCYENDNEPQHATPIQCGEAQRHHSIMPAGDQDWVTFALTEPKGVRLETEGPAGGDTFLYLLDSDMHVVATNDDRDPGARNWYSRITVDSLPPGKYYGMARHYFATETIADYGISLRCTTGDWYEVDGEARRATPIGCGETQRHHSIMPAGDRDWVTFTLTECSRVTLETEGEAGGDTFLHLYDSRLRPLAENDDKNPAARDFFSRIASHALPAGTYYAAVRHYFADRTIGSYSIRLTCVPVDCYEEDDEAQHASRISCGQTQQRHSLLPAADRDWVTFTLTKRKRVVLETEGEAGGDTFLYLFDSALRVVATNDDKDPGGPNRYSRITVSELAPGTYYGVARHYFPDGTLANYQISLTCSDPP